LVRKRNQDEVTERIPQALSVASRKHWGWQDSAVRIRAADEDSGAVLLRVKVSIVGSDPAIWRLLEIDPSLTMDRVHEVLQTAVGWRDSHLHSFTDTDPYVRLRAVNGIVREPRRWVPLDLMEDSDGDLPETDWTLGQVLTPESGPLFYEYDFGDGWILRLELTGTLPAPGNAPQVRLRDGERRAPLEDSGGIGGYHDLLDALADPGHDEHEDVQASVAWTAGPWQEFDPEHLDINAVNNELALGFPAPSANEQGPGSESLTQELTNRMPPGLRREFRSYLHTAELDGPATVEAEAAEVMTPRISGSSAASGLMVYPSPLPAGCRRPSFGKP
jgi:hypothetical protein